MQELEAQAESAVSHSERQVAAAQRQAAEAIQKAEVAAAKGGAEAVAGSVERETAMNKNLAGLRAELEVRRGSLPAACLCFDDAINQTNLSYSLTSTHWHRQSAGLTLITLNTLNVCLVLQEHLPHSLLIHEINLHLHLHGWPCLLKTGPIAHHIEKEGRLPVRLHVLLILFLLGDNVYAAKDPSCPGCCCLQPYL